MKNYNEMTNAELYDIRRELSSTLDTYNPSSDEWSAAYKEYCSINAILDERYRVENQPAFDAFYEEHIKGKKWEDIDPEDWGFYSDWHKDMYGFRPRSI